MSIQNSDSWPRPFLTEVKIRYTPSAHNYSDILTKPLTEVMFQRMIEMCLGSKDSQIVERGHQMEGFLCTGYDSYIVYIYYKKGSIYSVFFTTLALLEYFYELPCFE